ncbi:ABC transporter permease [Pseudolysinimonas sp.]|uniref:ABC transporter permease n=1 Tax=Pseudolysinimonas sp. TaxID=2680009 RepID=UPI003263D0BF
MTERPTASEVLHDIASGTPLRIFLAVVLSLAVASVLIIFTNKEAVGTLNYVFSRPSDFFAAAGRAVGDAYAALFRGSIYNYNARNFEGAIRPLTESLRFAGPLIAAGLGIALSFRVGLFNIGGQGQMLMAAAFAGWASFQLHLPFGIHLVAALLFGLVGAGLWAGIVGFLKARTGAHEVIVTIMLNYIAVSLVSYAMRTPLLQDPAAGSNPKTQAPDVTAQYPPIFGPAFDIHIGIILALGAVVLFWWLMERSTLGFRLRMVGLNPDAARTAGIDVNRTYIIAMVISGLFLGLAGANQALGRDTGFTPTVDSGIGFDAITVALLGGSRAIGVMLAGLLFGALKAAGPQMQLENVAPDILAVVQALIVLFIAAPPLVRSIFRFLPAPRAEQPQLATRRKPRLEVKETEE